MNHTSGNIAHEPLVLTIFSLDHCYYHFFVGKHMYYERLYALRKFCVRTQFHLGLIVDKAKHNNLSMDHQI